MIPGSTPQVTFPPGAGHDRYEENFNGPATYAEPYVERYGIKSDFSGREPLHPTPPRPGYVPTLGQTPPSSTQGSVMMVYGLQPDKVNTDKLFNLFCLYGNVTKVIPVNPRLTARLNKSPLGTIAKLPLTIALTSTCLLCRFVFSGDYPVISTRDFCIADAGLKRISRAFLRFLLILCSSEKVRIFSKLWIWMSHGLRVQTIC